MVWAKVDDRLHSSVKWRAASKGARALWATALSWCADQETDGHVPVAMLAVLDGTKAEVRSLLDAGLWEESSGGWKFCNWAEYQPVRAQLEERRERERARLAEKRAKRANVARNAEATRSSVGDVLNTPTRPDPTRPPISTPSGADIGDARARSPFCPEHHPTGPGGKSCRACGDARAAFQYQQADGAKAVVPFTVVPGSVCADGHAWLPDGTCTRCEARKESA